jgi:hypothetical protein
MWHQKSADALLLLLWIVGTFCFATFFNWSITARTFLPMGPAVATPVANLTMRWLAFGRLCAHV